MTANSAGVVVIGRNEGDRLIACLKSLRGAGVVVYVDSGSLDDSVNAAAALGADVVCLDMSLPFTAARARNAGIARLCEVSSPRYIQVIDGDCTLDDKWLNIAAAFLDQRTDVAVVCGRRRERRPEASLYNRLCDIEWATPIGEAAACGGDALIRGDALKAAGFYNDSLIAGEEPELCLRIREKGWKIWRLDVEMTSHDAAMTKFSQWWTRSKRAGHAFAEISSLHRASPFRIWRRETLRALFWAGIAPASILLSITISPLFLILPGAYPAQILRLYFSRRNALGEDAAPWAALTVIGKFAEASGVLKYYFGKVAGRKSGLFEYK